MENPKKSEKQTNYHDGNFLITGAKLSSWVVSEKNSKFQQGFEKLKVFPSISLAKFITPKKLV